LVTALSRLLTPLKLASSDGGALVSVPPAACGLAATKGAAVAAPCGIRRTPRAGTAAGVAREAVRVEPVVPVGKIVPATALAWDTVVEFCANASGAINSPTTTIEPTNTDKHARLRT
jgi:hypothetical protein